MNSRPIAAILILALLASCAPPQSSVERPAAKVVPGGPRLDDVDLKISEEGPKIVKINWDEPVSEAVVFRLTENLLELREGLPPSARAEWSEGLLRSLPHDRTRIGTSEYAELVIEQTEGEAHALLDEVLPKLRDSGKKIRVALNALPLPIKPQETPSFEETVARGLAYAKSFEAKLPELGLLPIVAASVKSELDTRLPKLQEEVDGFIRKIKATRSLKSALDVTLSFTKKNDFKLSSASTSKAKRGLALGNKIDSYTTAQGALSVLVEIWLFLDPSERDLFKKVNQDLYDYLIEQGESDLECLKDPSCLSIPKWIAKKLVIEPKLEAYGLERIRKDINERAADSVRTLVRKELADVIRGLPKLIADLVEKKINEKKEPFERLKSDFRNQLRTRIAQWASKGIEQNGPSLFRARPVRGQMKIDSSGRVRLNWVQISSRSLESRGSTMALSPRFWEQQTLDPAMRRSVLLAEISGLAKDYRDIRAGKTVTQDNLSARSFAEIVRGLSRVARNFRDWEKSEVDGLVGSYMVRELFPEIDLPELNREIFPKAAFFAMSFASLSEHLKTITDEKSQIFVVDLNNKVKWANEERSEDTVMVGIADRQNGERSHLVRAEDVARYLIALTEFLDATADIHKTKSEFLLKPDKDGQIPRDQIMRAREKIRLLVLGLSNYLSHQFRAGGDLIVHWLDIDSQRPIDRTVTVFDQALSIRALLAASKTLKSDIYLWEAIDLVSAMNRTLYKPELGFYGRKEETTVSPPVLVETLRALELVSPHLKPESRAQIERIAKPWRATINSWRFGNRN
jgi:hypothetical protein